MPTQAELEAIFQQQFGRSVGQEGLDYWRKSELGGADLKAAILSGASSADREAALNKNYNTLFKRDVGKEGVDYWAQDDKWKEAANGGSGSLEQFILNGANESDRARFEGNEVGGETSGGGASKTSTFNDFMSTIQDSWANQMKSVQDSMAHQQQAMSDIWSKPLPTVSATNEGSNSNSGNGQGNAFSGFGRNSNGWITGFNQSPIYTPNGMSNGRVPTNGMRANHANSNAWTPTF